MSDIFNNSIYEKLGNSRNFQKLAPLRKEVKSIISEILADWKGPNKDRCLDMLDQKIEVAGTEGRDETLQLYINIIGPILKQQAYQESQKLDNFKQGDVD